jgi:hypothetical protein
MRLKSVGALEKVLNKFYNRQCHVKKKQTNTYPKRNHHFVEISLNLLFVQSFLAWLQSANITMLLLPLLLLLMMTTTEAGDVESLFDFYAQSAGLCETADHDIHRLIGCD